MMQSTASGESAPEAARQVSPSAVVDLRPAVSATTVNYIDRLVFGILKPVFERELGWTEPTSPGC